MSNGKIIKWDETEIDTFDHVTDEFYIFTRRETAILLALMPFVRWRTRWNLINYDKAYLEDLASEIGYRLMTPITIEIQTCDDVENCLTTSPTIASIESNVATNTAAAETAQSTADAAQSTANNNSQAIEEQQASSPTNDYPDPPTQATDESGLCAVAWYIARELDTFIQDTITDASTITLLEFLKALLGIGGFKQSLLIQLWQFIVANTNPNLSQEVTDAIEYVAEAFYCNDLDRALARSDIDADSRITEDAQAAYIGAIDAWTESKFAIATAVGIENNGEDCSTFCFESEWVYTFDFTTPVPSGKAVWQEYQGAAHHGYPLQIHSGLQHCRIDFNDFDFLSPITRIKLTGESSCHRGNLNMYVRFGNDAAGFETFVIETALASGITDTVYTFDVDWINLAGWNVKFGRIEMRYDQGTSHAVHYAKIDTLTIWGNGVNPFI